MIIGIDVGSVTVSLAGINHNSRVVYRKTEEHAGDVRGTVERLLEELPFSEIEGVASAAPNAVFKTTIPVYDTTVCVISGVRMHHTGFGSILHAGGQRFFLAEFSGDGTYRRSKGSSSCAAGTGSFLDQQARRLGLPGSFRIAELAESNRGNRPEIASRCAVFAKTDLIHAQQEGYTLSEICDGLCYGLARNLTDTVSSGNPAASPLILSGGVALNKTVVRYIGELLGVEPVVGEYPQYYGAVGACLEYQKETHESPSLFSPRDILRPRQEDNPTFYNPLLLDAEDYPDFSSGKLYSEEGIEDPENIVEVEIFRESRLQPYRSSQQRDVIMGFDIGSTSTKAAVTDENGEALFGFYTRTAGRPLTAVRSILRSLHHLLEREKLDMKVRSAAATGSGRKFAGTVLGADLIVDEITAHAKAAYQLNPETDTIIEIGGQDAKFTTMRKGMVTFSQMNTVCAAGTGSFIEEQAASLGVSLAEYSGIAEEAKAPMASDRCTVFMERDIKQFLTTGYTVPEILASVLHSVRENYLQKVAAAGAIGKKICFQGATGKNRALVAAFRQKLKKPIYVSRFCHLTGALGAALLLKEEGKDAGSFRGIDIYRKEISVRTERCQYCRNHCRIRIARVGDEEVAYGFLCGRDYETKRYVTRKEEAFDLLDERRRALRLAAQNYPELEKEEERNPVIGIPAALHLLDDLHVWERFFHNLGMTVVTSINYTEGIKRGRNLTGAEFCSPITELHGHVMHLLKRADFVFLPEYFQYPTHAASIKSTGEENPNFKPGSYYCYYTQYASVMMEEIGGGKHRRRILRPLTGYMNYGEKGMIRQLTGMLKRLSVEGISHEVVYNAYRNAGELDTAYRSILKDWGESLGKGEEDIKIVLTGRPYTIVSPHANKNIPGIIAQQGLKPIFQDMLPEETFPSEEQSIMLSLVPWAFAYQILKTAYRCIETPGLYPVFVTSFKCSPDSFITEFFKRILDQAGKPYLILQVDEHDSSVGYETRIEAGVRAFRNHYRQEQPPKKISAGPMTVHPEMDNTIMDKTVLIPNWDPITNPLLAANLRETAGIDARVLKETPELISRGMRHNTGQCIPANVIAEEVMDYIGAEGLDPEKTTLWMPRSGLVCNLAMYPAFIKTLLENQGDDFRKVGVFSGEFTFVDISLRTTINAYFAYLFGGLLRRIACMLRPYEIAAGSVDKAVEDSVEELIRAFQGDEKKLQAVKNTVSRLEGVAVIPEEERPCRPKAAIFGDVYIRDNEVINQNIIKTIESAGGEVVTTPYSDYVKIIAGAYFKKLRKRKHYRELVIYRNMLRAISLLEGIYYRHFSRFKISPAPHRNPYLREEIGSFGLRIEHTGESFENTLKIFHVLKAHPDISLFVQLSPAFCCPSMVTEAMAPRIESVTGVPVVSVIYDGTGTPVNDAVVPYIVAARERVRKEEVETRR